MSKHTPGPWEAPHIDDDVSARQFHIYEQRGDCGLIAIVDSGADTDEANARLIAAAPMLLEALQEAEARPLVTEGADWWIKVRAAIAAATGSDQ